MPFLIIMGFVAMIFMVLGICVINKKEPANFWTGQEVKPGEIGNVKAYNKALGLLWIGLSVLIWVTAIVGFVFGGIVGTICMIATFVIGIPMLPVIYNRIYAKYRNPDGK